MSNDNIDVMVFVRHSKNFCFLKASPLFEMVWNSGDSAIMIVSKAIYLTIRQSVIIGDNYPIKEIQLIQPKTKKPY